MTTRSQLARLLEIRNRPERFVEIGYNRRSSPSVREARRMLARESGPVTMTCLVRELSMPDTDWYFWPNQGARMAGNLCHWFDLGVHFIGERPESMTAVTPLGWPTLDEVSVSVSFSGGSLLTIVGSCRGNSLRGDQESILIRRGDMTIEIDDFLRMRVLAGRRRRTIRSRIRDRGHRGTIERFMARVETGRDPTYPNEDLRRSSLLYLAAAEGLTDSRRPGGAASFAADLPP